MTKKELEDLIQVARQAGRDVIELKGFLAEVSLAEPLKRKPPVKGLSPFNGMLAIRSLSGLQGRGFESCLLAINICY